MFFATGLGIEPRFTASKAAVLPLDDPVLYEQSYLTDKSRPRQAREVEP